MVCCLGLLVLSMVGQCGVIGPPEPGDPVYFLVAEIVPSHNDSYVLPLYDPADIAHARALLGPDTPDATIVNACIARGADLINRNYVQPGLPTWSWCVVGFEGFSGVSIEICDGWATGIEEGIFEGDLICFWAYTVVAELGPETELEAWNCDLDADGDVNFCDFAMFAAGWSEKDCGHRFWCGGADIDLSGSVNARDLAIFARNWLWSN